MLPNFTRSLIAATGEGERARAELRRTRRDPS